MNPAEVTGETRAGFSVSLCELNRLPFFANFAIPRLGERLPSVVHQQSGQGLGQLLECGVIGERDFELRAAGGVAFQAIR